MHFFKTLVAAAALVASTVAQSKIQFTTFPKPSNQVGAPITVTWTGGAPGAPVTITLRKGPSTDLKDVEVLTSSATGGSFTFTPSSSLAPGSDYALQIKQGADINFTGLFAIIGGTGSASSSAGSSSSRATTQLSSSSMAPSTTVRLSTGVSSSFISRGTGVPSSSRNATTIQTPTLSTRPATLTPTRGATSTGPSIPVVTGNVASFILASPAALIVGLIAACVRLV